MVTRESLLADIDAYLAAHGMKESTFGKRVVNDGKLLRRLRSGGSVNLETAGAIISFIQSAVPPRVGRA